MKILAIERELSCATKEGFYLHANAEARRVWELVQEGVIRETCFRADRDEAVLTLECASVEEAQLSTLPFVKNGLIEFEFIPLKAYPGFERLFAKD